MSIKKFLNSSLLLFADLLVTAGGGWLYWLVFSKLVSPGDIGVTTAVYSLAGLMVLFSELGLEYPLLKRTSSNPSHALGTSLLIEIGLILLIMPILFIVMVNFYVEPIRGFAWIATMIMGFTSLSFVLRYVLLATFNTKKVFVINTISTISKFVIAYVLVINGLGSLGLLLSFVAQALILSISYLIYSIKSFGLNFGGWQYLRSFLKDGLVNTPSKLARMLSLNLSIILLAYVGIANSELGTFYIALTISIAVGSLISSMSYMIIPTSAESRSNLSYLSLKYSISLTAPLIAGLITAPAFVLSLIGPQYSMQDISLVILSIAILPYSVLTTSISSFNFTGDSKRIIIVGSVQVSVFLIAFLYLVPSFGTIGTSLAILFAFTASSVICLRWTERIATKYFINSGIAVALGWLVGFGVLQVSYQYYYYFAHIAGIVTAMIVTFGLLLLLGNLSLGELRRMVNNALRIT
jgi:O-antigen/teichoic acid export membrane protein